MIDLLDTTSLDKDIILDIIDILYKAAWKILSYLKANKEREIPITSKDLQEVFDIDDSTVSCH